MDSRKGEIRGENNNRKNDKETPLCIFEIKYGKQKGKYCGFPCKLGSSFCSRHILLVGDQSIIPIKEPECD